MIISVVFKWKYSKSFDNHCALLSERSESVVLNLFESFLMIRVWMNIVGPQKSGNILRARSKILNDTRNYCRWPGNLLYLSCCQWLHLVIGASPFSLVSVSLFVRFLFSLVFLYHFQPSFSFYCEHRWSFFVAHFLTFYFP